MKQYTFKLSVVPSQFEKIIEKRAREADIEAYCGKGHLTVHKEVTTRSGYTIPVRGQPSFIWKYYEENQNTVIKGSFGPTRGEKIAVSILLGVIGMCELIDTLINHGNFKFILLSIVGIYVWFCFGYMIITMLGVLVFFRKPCKQTIDFMTSLQDEFPVYKNKVNNSVYN